MSIVSTPEVGTSTHIADCNGRLIKFGDTVRFKDRAVWHKTLLMFNPPKGGVDNLPYEQRTVTSVEDYNWLLDSEVDDYWEVTL